MFFHVEPAHSCWMSGGSFLASALQRRGDSGGDSFGVPTKRRSLRHKPRQTAWLPRIGYSSLLHTPNWSPYFNACGHQRHCGRYGMTQGQNEDNHQIQSSVLCSAVVTALKRHPRGVKRGEGDASACAAGWLQNVDKLMIDAGETSGAPVFFFWAFFLQGVGLKRPERGGSGGLGFARGAPGADRAR